ncbi:MAG: hypothetical protein E7655_04860 [Ruminococcaceae bacterium]|nr:hypothetical protein [Oscillospiraceae bacterium]
MKHRALCLLLPAVLMVWMAACDVKPSLPPDTESDRTTTESQPTDEPNAAIENEPTAENQTINEPQPIAAYAIEPPAVFVYDGTRYDMRERNASVNAIFGPTVAGKHLVIEGHVGPYNSVYSVFNTETRTFEKDLSGTNLIWRGEDIESAVYSFWQGIYTYGGNKIADVNLEPITEFIDELAFVGEDELLVTVSGKDGDRTQTIPLAKAE